MLSIRYLPVAAFLAIVAPAFPQTASENSEQSVEASVPEQRPDGATFGLADGKPGVALEAFGGNLYVNSWLRAQLRYSDPFDSDPRSLAALADPPGSDIEFRRSRFKTQVNLFGPDIGIYFEKELGGDMPVLDLRMDLSLRDDLDLRIGQYKVLYNRERVDSSGRQQFTERSIANRVFTVDRQRGITVQKRIAAGSRADSLVYVGVFEGEGRDPGELDSDPMFVARWQWQLLGRSLPFSQGDLLFRDEPAATLAFGYATVTGPYTRYSSSGGGQLDGFQTTTDDRYEIRQWLQEFAWHYRGVSIQQEYHEKRIDDRETGRESLLRGGYAQIGKAWPLRWLGRDRAFELAGRWAYVDQDDSPLDSIRNELTVAANFFLSGHNNKFTIDLSQLTVNEAGGADGDDYRLRLQWDVSF